MLVPSRNALFFVSNRLLRNTSQYGVCSLLDLGSGVTEDLGLESSVPMPNGAFLLASGKLAILSQGTFIAPAGVFEYDLATGDVHALTQGFGPQSLPFSSPNDIVQAGDGALWFTDPPYGVAQGFRPAPVLGAWVWRFAPGDAAPARVMLDGFVKPNGLAFSADGYALFVSDTGYATGSSAVPNDSSAPRTIYKFAISSDAATGAVFASQRTVFAVATAGIPDGIKVDPVTGNVWAGTGAGLEVFSPGGALLAIIALPGGVGCSNFALVADGAYVMAETSVLRLYTSPDNPAALPGTTATLSDGAIIGIGVGCGAALAIAALMAAVAYRRGGYCSKASATDVKEELRTAAA